LAAVRTLDTQMTVMMLPVRDAVRVSAADLAAQIPLRRSIISTSNQARLKDE
jgi:hypothetical protein